MSTAVRARASYDLHLHTWWSYDAASDPRCYLQQAAARDMCCLAITEHHNLDSQAEVFAAAAQYPTVRVLRAAELTVQTSIGPVDLLCYGFPEAWPGPLRQLMDRYRRWQCDYGAAVCRGMQAQGFGYSQQDRRSLLETYRPAQVLAVQGTTHVRNEVQRNHFLRRGYIASPQEYPLLLMRLEQEHALPEYPPVQEVVPVVHAAGALAVIAHPFGYFDGANPARMDALRDECRFDGIECAHLLVPLELTPVYRRYCLAHGLVSTAGSDCHTHADIDLTFGRHGGARNWLDELLERLPS